MKTRKIGERFECLGVTLEVVEWRRCNGCYFFEWCKYKNKLRPRMAGYCSFRSRKDKTSVIFKEIKKL